MKPHNLKTPPQGLKKRAGRKIFKDTHNSTDRSVRQRNGGTLSDPEAAAHDGARINFPDSSWCLPRASRPNIRRATPEASRKVVRSVSSSSSINACEIDSSFRYENRIEFMDEEAVFNMPVLLDSMAEGLVLTPLAMRKGFNWSAYEVDDGIDLNLWGLNNGNVNAMRQITLHIN